MVRLTNLGRPDQSFGSNGQLAIPYRPLVALATFDFDNLKVGVVSLNGNGYLGHMQLRRENGDLLGLIDFTSDGDFESLSVQQAADPTFYNGPGTYLLDIAAQDENFFVLMHESAALRIYKYSLVPKPGGSGTLDIVKDDSFTTEMPDIVGITLQDDANLLVDGEYIYVSHLPSLSAVPNRVYRVSIDGGLDTDWGNGEAVKIYRQTNQTGLEMFPSPSGGVDVYSANTSGALPYGELPVKVTRLNNSGSVIDEQSFSVGPEDERIGFGLPHLGGHLLIFGKFEDTDVMRVNSWGEIDTSFADSYGEELDFVNFTSMKPLPDGSAVGIGSLRHSSSEAVVVKIDPEGNLDDSFGGEDAYRTLDRIADATLDGGRIFVVGNSQVNIGGPKRLWSIGAYEINGDLDPNFGDNGLATIVMHENSSAHAVAMDQRYIYVTGNAGGQLALVRYHRTGELDYGFGSQGRLQVSIAGRPAGGNTIAIDRYQRPTVAGYVQLGNRRYPALQRYVGDGDLDVGFGSSGTVFKKVGQSAEIHDLVIQPNQNIVAVGHVDTPSGSDVLVMRYKPNGKLDPTFGNGGKVITDLGTKGDRANAVTLDRHGRIVVTGVTGGSDTDFVTLRYASDGKPDSTFGKYGVVTTNLGSRVEEATDVKIDVNQRIVVSGTTGKDDDAVFAVMRYLPNGDPDPDFEGNPYDLPGSVTTDIGVGAEHANGLVLLKSQLPIVVGSSIGAEWNELFPDYNVTIEGYFASAQKLGTKTTAQQAGTTADQLTLDIMYSAGKTKAVFLHVIRDEDTAEFVGAVQTTMYVEFDGPPSNRICAVSMNFASTYKQPWK
ncbi:MAG TPA: hypothetical protein DGO43_03010 [Chloroflexi bacterium]|nr:hypothetical protein [Chloroflexota bacterium]